MNFDEIASRVADTVERPPLAPIGTYVFVVTKLPTRRDVQDRNGGPGWEAIEYPLIAVRPTDDVDPDLFAAYGEAKNIRVTKNFMFTKDENDKAGFEQTMFNMKEFLVKHLGGDGSKTILELMNDSVNKQCLGVLGYRADTNDKSIQYHSLGRTAPLA